ncbi:MAG: class I SAM-dependent methyltransferase [Gammaproteobacteria bacterium]|nr:class I SAM-dependent methyltransferase [Gammaproteobacteria bacterium]
MKEFTGKYTSNSGIAQRLIEHFFTAVESLYRRTGCGMSSALEVGAGEGFSTRRLHAMLDEGVSFEASELLPDQVKAARSRNPQLRITQESIYDLQRLADSADLVFCLEVLEHLEEPRKALAELARVARHYVIVSTPNEPLWRVLNFARGKYLRDWGNTPGHIQHWSTRSLCDLVAERFEVCALEKPLPWSCLLLKPRAT